MALNTSFSNQVTDFPSSLDKNFNQVGAMGITACAATGNNAIALSPLAGQPTVGVYQNYQLFGFVAAGTSNGPVTIAVGNLAPQILLLADATTQASGADIIGGAYYVVVYNTALNGGLGGMQLFTQMPVSSLLDILGSSQGSILTRGSSGWVTLANGVNGDLLESEGNSLVWANPGIRNSKQLVIQNSGAFKFSSSSGITTNTVVRIILVGAGGGGAGGAGGSGSGNGVGGGAGGAIAIGYISGLSANTLYSGAVGAGGAAGAGTLGNGTNGGAGGTTTISFGGVQFTAGGGGGGISGGGTVANAASGGIATNATILIRGSSGCPGGTGVPISGQGGRGYWGGSASVLGGLLTTQGANSPGAGGAGGASSPTADVAGLNGIAGKNGILIMEWVE